MPSIHLLSPSDWCSTRLNSLNPMPEKKKWWPAKCERDCVMGTCNSHCICAAALSPPTSKIIPPTTPYLRQLAGDPPLFPSFPSARFLWLVFASSDIQKKIVGLFPLEVFMLAGGFPTMLTRLTSPSQVDCRDKLQVHQWHYNALTCFHDA